MVVEEKLAEVYVNGIPILTEEGEGFSRTQMQRAFIAGFKANSPEWHYIAEEGLPAEADKYYFIAYQTALGLSGSYCKLVEEKVPIVPGYGHVTGYNTIKKWYCEDSEVSAWMNERGRVYAWMPLPALPEVKE